jgi:phosphoenolpyruvate-protein kinase (PTS system EI component)
MTSALGLQGARLFDTEPVAGVVRAQLEAIAGLARTQPLGVIIPYLTHVAELRGRLTEVRRTLGPSVPVGAMAETPAAVLDIGGWLDQADFVAIGCNDLMQGLFAADRDQPALRGWLDPHAPVLFRLLAQAAAAAGERIDRLQLCGLLPQLRGLLPVLLGLGFRAVSVDAAQIPYLAALVRAAAIPEAEDLAGAVCAATDADEVRTLLDIASP